MPYIFIYSPSDFVNTPPAEQGAQAAGSPTFTLQLRPGATGTRVFIDDDDAVFDEVDATQSLGEAVDLDGTNYAVGTTINTAYDLINTATGHQVTSFHFGGDGFQQGAVDGIASTVELVPGTAYTFNTERTSHQQPNQYANFVSCLASGAMILTPDGSRAVETLRVGDLVQTEDAGPQPVRWVGARTVAGVGDFAPVRLSAGFLGLEQPLFVSPQHRMLVEGADIELMFGVDSAFVAAKHLCDGRRGRVTPCAAVTYHHLMFDTHEVIWANGARTESFLPEIMGLHGLDRAARDELFALFPELAGDASQVLPRTARLCLRSYEAALLT
ncbi:Hint domain-containing protein [uncultured Tateyamaria sp.]|uniref:Hint domain-containing protein n=1 Tax=uncultured Tateyamaria sp. TaxID=455651 RepID=UPI0026245A1F|nr:Hint domain-containing protein [uncultured Tateyamaria sp.]